MGIGLGGIEALLILFYRLVVEPVQIVALKDSVRGCPVVLAMLQVIDVAMVLVAHFVP